MNHKRWGIFLLALCMPAILFSLSGCRAATTSTPASSGVSTTAPQPQQWDMRPPQGISNMGDHMLWPIEIKAGMTSYGDDIVYYGFINEKGETVAPPVYLNFYYEKDSQGRHAYLVASAEDHIDIFTMDGVKYLGIEGQGAYLWIDDNLVYVWIERGYYGPLNNTSRVTLYDFASGERLLYGDYISFNIINQDTILLIDPDFRQYVWKRGQDESAKMPLTGYYNAIRDSVPRQTDDWLILSSNVPESIDSPSLPLYGFVGMDGKWAIEPIYEDATQFYGQYAGVREPNGLWHFINRQGESVDETRYQYISHYFENQLADRDIVFQAYATDNSPPTYLDGDLQPVVIPQTPANTDSATGWIDGVYCFNGRKIDFLPQYSTDILYADSSILIAHPYEKENTYFLNTETGVEKWIDGKYWRIVKVEDVFVSAKSWGPDEPLVLDSSGNMLQDTVFHHFPAAALNLIYNSNMTVPGGKYFWVTTGSYQGYINYEGEWAFRQSRFQLLDD